ncbi:MAG: class I SAM-dependent methyltransferase [Spirochaetes bacterium]|nr:class I SAM-dependent methyltransferase [Spirochaetota bacterium]
MTRFVQEKPMGPGLWQKFINLIINDRAWFQRIIARKRKDLLASRSREELNDKLWQMHKWLMPFYLVNLPGTRKDWNAVKRLEFMKLFSQGKILDVGCEDGFFVRELRKAGLDAHGVDSLEAAVNHCRKKDPGGTYFSGFAESIKVPGETYDTAILSHVLEHVWSPPEVLKEAARVLKKGGRLLVVVPFGYGNEPNHLRIFSRETLAAAVAPWFTVEEQFDFIGDGFGLVARRKTGASAKSRKPAKAAKKGAPKKTPAKKKR